MQRCGVGVAARQGEHGTAAEVADRFECCSVEREQCAPSSFAAARVVVQALKDDNEETEEDNEEIYESFGVLDFLIVFLDK